MYVTAVSSLFNLISYCQNNHHMGWDPYDGLNSKVFKVYGLNKITFVRLLWIQLFKRNPINLRRLFWVTKGYNPKGIGLFLSAYSKQLMASKEECGDKLINVRKNVIELADLLIDLRSEGYSGSCWGYNFDWQARGGLFFPSGTPTIVATTYAAYGLFDAYEATGNSRYLNVALDTVNFVIKDLSRDYRDDGTFLFSYSVKNGNNTVYNASLLGSKLLSRAYYYNKDKSLIDIAKGSVQAVMNAQEEDGSWVYGMLPVQSWIDSFHTGYNLDAISIYQNCTGDNQFNLSLKKGFTYYIAHFFEADGTPKYYNNKTYPIDIHCPAQLFVTLSKLDQFKTHQDLASKVFNWSINNMQSKTGYFYYQIKKGWSSKISYMRWSNAFMFNAMTFYYKEYKAS